ncbi:concanavalin A-like lectin/glucanase domain-containing protein [Coniochaeta sp. 2T2.1]|nr:concanavalin A-like lectin/glucanase domain-containing protein [Coniochaeta sp. 2T2.1]
MRLHVLAATALLGLAHAICECGYKTNTGETWQYAVETDFSNGSFPSNDWAVSQLVRQATVDLNYTRENVVISDGKLELTCSAYNSTVGGGIRSGQIRTTRRDILYGSFRASYSVIAQSPGSVAGFFFYANDTQEIDIEIQSKTNNQTVHLGNQPASFANIYLPNNGVVTEMHDYRFDWLKDETTFYLDGVPAGGFAQDTPITNGTISLNMWGNGGTFSGPQTPTTDNIMAISKIMIYFNTSSASLSQRWERACQTAKRKTRPVCVVDTAGLSVNRTSASIAHSAKANGQKLSSLRKLWPLGVGAALYNI